MPGGSPGHLPAGLLQRAAAAEGAAVAVGVGAHLEGGRAHALAVHAGKWAEMERLAEEAWAVFGRIDILVNNAGMSPALDSHAVSEDLFDKVLARELARTHEVTFAVRGRPIINDVTAEDARLVGMDAHATVISTGCSAPGAILSACSDDFRATFDRADLVISKGQGNFEALSDVPRPMYYLLKAKCPKIAHALDVEVGDYVFTGAQVAVAEAPQ